ncbi:hypothetical protein ABH924_004922 [Arthrobacter sp. GAS37]|uniref:hypothetical protein n=1 Tax=Arthrobacter sp. GAS37 TaxID=3156261 RepID=UPI0038386AC2
MTFNAPQFSTFNLAAATVQTFDATTGTYSATTTITGCVLSSGNTVLTCPATSVTVPASSATATSTAYFSAPSLTISSSAPYNTTLTGSETLTATGNPEMGGGTVTVGYTTAASASTPMIDPIAGGGPLAGASAIAGGVWLVRKRRTAATA